MPSILPRGRHTRHLKSGAIPRKPVVPFMPFYWTQKTNKQTNKANREALAVFHASWLLGLANHEWPQLARLVHVYGKEDGHVHVALLPTVSCSAPFAKESQVHQHSKFPMQKSLRGSPAIFLKAVFPVPGCLQPHFRPKRLFR